MKWRQALILIAAVSAVACNRQPAPPQAQAATDPHTAVTRSGNLIRFPLDSPKLDRITVEEVQTAAIPMDDLIAPGRVEMLPSRISRITPPVAGRVVRVLVGLGDSIRANQALLTLDSPDAAGAIAALRAAEANVAQERAGRMKAEADFERSRDLLEHRAIAQKEVLAAETLVAQAREMVATAEAAREEALRRLRILGLKPGDVDQQITVYSTIPGKVVELATAPGEFRNDTATPMLTVADLSRVWVSADVPESAIRHVALGHTVDISLAAYPDESFPGHITQIGDLVDPQTRTIRVRAEVDNRHGKFRPEMFAQIRSGRGMETLPVIPRAALFQKQEGDSVFREIARGQFEEVMVFAAWQDGNRVAIRSGVRAGDRVVTDGVAQMRAY